MEDALQVVDVPERASYQDQSEAVTRVALGVASANGTRRTRTLSSHDVFCAIRDADKTPGTLVRDSGGYVANKYGYPAYTSVVRAYRAPGSNVVECAIRCVGASRSYGAEPARFASCKSYPAELRNAAEVIRFRSVHPVVRALVVAVGCRL